MLALLACGFGCGKSPNSAAGPAAAPKPKLYWIQPLKGHPVHQMTQIAFRDACRDNHYDFEIIGTDGWDVAGTIALAEQALARNDAAGLIIWTGSPAWIPFLAKAGRAGVPIILPHFPPEGDPVAGVSGVISCDPVAYAQEAARTIGQAIAGKGCVAVTQGSFNTVENLVSDAFARSMKSIYPRVAVLPPEEESFDVPSAVAKAASLLEAHPEINAAFSTTGGGAMTWAGAQKQVGKKIVAIAMDYTRPNLDLVKSGQIYAVIAQPLWEESYGAVELIHTLLAGGKIPYWTKLPAPILTRDKLGPYYERLDRFDRALKR